MSFTISITGEQLQLVFNEGSRAVTCLDSFKQSSTRPDFQSAAELSINRSSLVNGCWKGNDMLPSGIHPSLSC